MKKLYFVVESLLVPVILIYGKQHCVLTTLSFMDFLSERLKKKNDLGNHGDLPPSSKCSYKS